jgi:enolase
VSKSTIISVTARQIFSAREHPAVEATVTTENGAVGIVHCVAGVSIGTHEVAFTYDGGSRWHGKGVQRAVNNVNQVIAPVLVGMDAARQQEIDEAMLALEGGQGKAKLGGNAVAAVSAAALKAASQSLGIPLYQHLGGMQAVTLPCPAFGSVAGCNRYIVDNSSGSKPTFSFISHGFDTYSEALDALWEVWSDWTRLMGQKFGLQNWVSTEGYIAGGFVTVPPGLVESDYVLWDWMTEIIGHHGFESKIGFQVDMAGDCFYNKESNLFEGYFDSKPKTREQLIETIINITRNYPFVIMEDPLREDDYEGHAILTKETGIQIVGDDLFTTNQARLEEGIRLGAANTVLLKVNQIGTITEALEMIRLAYDEGYGIMPCASRGENLDIADYCVGINAGSLRESCIGTVGNRFLQIEKELGSAAKFAGTAGLKGNRTKRLADWGMKA